jgi:hypothetical protein
MGVRIMGVHLMGMCLMGLHLTGGASHGHAFPSHEDTLHGHACHRRACTCYTGPRGSAHALAVLPWHTGCLFVSSHAIFFLPSLDLMS